MQKRSSEGVRRHMKEEVILLLQLFMFYIFPLFAGPTDAMGMVLLILLATMLLSLMMGLLLKRRIKYLYPVVTAVSFIPSVFIYYNESALVHGLWYFAATAAGLLPGAAVRRLVCGRPCLKKER